MQHGEEQFDQATTSFEIIDEPRNEGETSRTTVETNDTTTREEKERILERIERGMEEFRKGECSRFQASTRVAKELEEWTGVSDKEKGKAFDTYLAEINSFAAIQNENRSNTREASQPIDSTLPTEQRANGKRIREEVEELLDRVSGEELEDEEAEQRVIRKRAREEDMPWYISSPSSSRRGSCIET